MLATCVVNGWDTATYRDPAHPLQEAIAETLAELTGDEITAVAVDGCGAPVMAVTPRGPGPRVRPDGLRRGRARTRPRSPTRSAPTPRTSAAPAATSPR